MVNGSDRKKRRMVNHGELDRFSKSMHDAKMAQIAIDKDRLDLERERLRMEYGEKEKKRENHLEQLQQ